MTREYSAWLAMKARCCIPTNHKFPIYGGRGIRVCERWLHDYSAFLADVGRRPTQEHSFDRIDVNGHYEPGNVRWATRKEQGRNRRATVLHELGGESLTIGEWAARAGIKPSTLRYRLNSGVALSDALARDVRRTAPSCTPDQVAELRSLRAAGVSRSECAERVGISYWTVRDIDTGRTHV